MKDWNVGFKQGIDTNKEALAIGASLWGRSPSNPKYARDEFNGVISEFVIYDISSPSNRLLS